jgi:hypothetical protein
MFSFALVYADNDWPSVPGTLGILTMLGGLMGAIAGSLTAKRSWNSDIPKPRRIRFEKKGMGKLISRGAFTGTAAFLFSGGIYAVAYHAIPLWTFDKHRTSIPTSAISVGVFGLTGAILGGIGFWIYRPVDLGFARSPQSTFRDDRATSITTGIAGGLIGGIVIGLFPVDGSFLYAAIVGPTIGFLVMYADGAWGNVLRIRLWLAIMGKIPWRLMVFLDDAHRRGVLRQAGAVYQFRHIRLQNRLAGDNG